jgi:hypothetical protein
MGAAGKQYGRDAEAVFAAVRDWKVRNPARTPEVGSPERVALVGSLSTVVTSPLVKLNDDARELARDIAKQVPSATWMMFLIAWRTAYDN